MMIRRLSTARRRVDSSSGGGVVEVAAKRIIANTERRLFAMFEKHGLADYIGEPISITEHSVQAAVMARERGESSMVQVACLLHDVGHLAGLEAGLPPAMDGCGTEGHEGIGASFLGSLGLPDSVSFLVSQHVAAKRYKCARNPEYYERLSEASKTTLRHQGGPFTEEECVVAEASEWWPHVLRMRAYDEAAKETPPTNISPRAFESELRSVLAESVAQQLEGDELVDGGGSTDVGQHVVSPRVHTPCQSQHQHQYPLSPFASSYVLSAEQLRAWREHGLLIVHGASAPPMSRLSSFSAVATDLASQVLREDAALLEKTFDTRSSQLKTQELLSRALVSVHIAHVQSAVRSAHDADAGPSAPSLLIEAGDLVLFDHSARDAASHAAIGRIPRPAKLTEPIDIPDESDQSMAPSRRRLTFFSKL
jgi:predicted HD phosphohydrolase